MARGLGHARPARRHGRALSGGRHAGERRRLAQLEARQRVQGRARQDDGDKKMRSILRAVLLASLLAPGAARAAVAVSVAPGYQQLVVGQTLQFNATVAGSADHGVVWMVDDIRAGNAGTGTITAGGLFTAPAAAPKPAIATITAVSKADPTASATAVVT